MICLTCGSARHDGSWRRSATESLQAKIPTSRANTARVVGHPFRGVLICLNTGFARGADECVRPYTRSVFEAVAEFYENLSWVVPVEAAEGDAVIEQDAAVGYVQRAD